MDKDLERRVDRLEQAATPGAKWQAAVEARAKVGRLVDKLIARIDRSEPVESFGSPYPDGPVEPSPARDRVMAMLDRLRKK